MNASIEVLPATDHPRLGIITTIRDDGLPFDSHDLGELLTRHDPEDLEPLSLYSQVAPLPGSKGMVLRWNYPRAYNSLPKQVDRLIAHVQEADHEFDRLQSLGARMLDRNVFVVEHRGQNRRPAVYTVTERRRDTRDLGDIEIMKALHIPIPFDTQKILGATAWTLVNYYDVNSDKPILYDVKLYWQYSWWHGELFDYDPYLSSDPTAKLDALGTIAHWADRYVDPSDQRTAILEKASALQARLSMSS